MLVVMIIISVTVIYPKQFTCLITNRFHFVLSYMISLRATLLTLKLRLIMSITILSAIICATRLVLILPLYDCQNSQKNKKNTLQYIRKYLSHLYWFW